jgi:hypothetical protein
MEDVIVSLQLSNDLWRQEVIQLNSQIRLTETYLENAKDRIRILEEIIRHFESDIKKREEQSKKVVEEDGIYTKIKSYVFG